MRWPRIIWRLYNELPLNASKQHSMVYKLQTAVKSIQIKLMSIKIAIAQFFLIAVAISICAIPSQPEGQCTECGPLDVLINGTCYIKIRGCLRHIPGPACLECQFGYVFSNRTCIREAVFFNNTNISFIPPVKITPNPTLSYEDIRNKLGELYGSYFSDAHEYFLSRYSQLGKGNIKNVERLETKKGVFLVIEYQGDSLNRYEAVAFIDNSNNFVKEWSFGAAQSGQKKDPFTANTQIRLALGDKLKDYFLYEFQQQGEIYIMNYMNTKNEVIRVTFNKNDIPLTNLVTKLDVKNLVITDLFFQEFIKMAPSYSNARMTSIQRYDDFYVVNFGPTSSVSFRFINNRFLINRPIQGAVNVYNGNQTQTPTSGFPNNVSLTGAWAEFTSYTDPRFIETTKYIVKEFPDLIGGQITKVLSQVVAGMNFVMYFRNKPPNPTINPDNYEIKAYYSIENVTQLLDGKKNGKTIFTGMLNYNQDAAFLTNYRTAENASRVLNVPAIDRVGLKILGTRRIYRVVYSPRQYLEFDYIPETNKVTLLSYNIDGENIIDTLSSAKAQAGKRTSEVLFNFLVSRSPVVARGKIQEIVENLPSYILTVVTNNGTYKAAIEDKGGDMNITQFVKISDVTCYDMSASEIQNSQKIKTIDEFLKNNYPIAGFNIQVIQINVQPTSYVYRILYASPKIKQIEIYLQEIDNVANVIKASYINFGYELVDLVLTNQDYQKITSVVKESNLAGAGQGLFFVEVNGSVIKGYYDDGKSTYEVYYDKALSKASSLVISTRPYQLLPDDFALNTLVFPPSPPPAQNSILTKIYQEAIKKYSVLIKDSLLVYADKRNNTYLLLFKNINGYPKLDATVDDLGNVVVGKLNIKNYAETDFSNCVKFSATGKCLSCSADTEVQYQGGCFKKLEGCLIQAGTICAKCNANYVKSANNCHKQCSNFFK